LPSGRRLGGVGGGKAVVTWGDGKWGLVCRGILSLSLGEKKGGPGIVKRV